MYLSLRKRVRIFIFFLYTVAHKIIFLFKLINNFLIRKLEQFLFHQDSVILRINEFFFLLNITSQFRIKQKFNKKKCLECIALLIRYKKNCRLKL